MCSSDLQGHGLVAGIPCQAGTKGVADRRLLQDRRPAQELAQYLACRRLHSAAFMARFTLAPAAIWIFRDLNTALYTVLEQTYTLSCTGIRDRDACRHSH